MAKNALLIVFIKNFEKGKVKSRLARDVGETKALDIYRHLLDHTRMVVEPLDVDVQAWFSSFVPERTRWNGERFMQRKQCGEDLGERMSIAVREAFASGYRKVAVIGSDCAEITTDIIRDAFIHLETNDTVVGPAADGGYYLIGMNGYHSELFEEKDWSTPALLNQTLQTCEDLSLSCYRLPELNDVDTVDDWNRIRKKFMPG